MIEYQGKQYVPDPALGEMPPLTKRQKSELKKSLLQEGQEARIFCRPSSDDPGKVIYVIDGWHRLALLITIADTPKFRMYPKTMGDDAVRDLAERLQAGRRQTADDWRLKYGREYNADKTPQGGDRKSNRQSDGLKKTAEKIAKKHDVSPRTVERAAKRAAAYDKLVQAAKTQVDEKKPSDAQVIALAKKPKGEQTQIARDIRVGSLTFSDALPKSNGKPRTQRKAAKKTADKTPAQKKQIAWKLVDNTRAALMRAIDEYQRHAPNKENQKYCLQQCRNIAGKLKSWK